MKNIGEGGLRSDALHGVNHMRVLQYQKLVLNITCDITNHYRQYIERIIMYYINL